MSSSYRKFYVALGAGALLGMTSRAPAANWQLLPRIEAGGTYNDNYRMAESPYPKLSVYGPYIDASVDAALISPRAKLDIVPRVHATYFPSDTADQSTNEYLDIDGDYRGLRSELKGVAQYSNESVIYSELLSPTFAGVGLGQQVGGVYGRVGVRNRRTMERVVPEYIYDLTQRTHLDLQAQYQHVTFGKTLFQQVGFTSYTGRLGAIYDATQRSKLSVTGVASRFMPQRGGFNTNRYGMNFQWAMSESQIMHTYLRVGASRVQANTNVGTVSTTGFAGGAGVEWKYQITEVVLDVIRDFTPSSVGSEVVSDQVRFRILHAFKPRFSGLFSARAVRLSGVSTRIGTAVQGEKYLAAELGAEYQVTMSSRIEATYDYTWQEFAGEPHAASNAVTLDFVYQPLSQYEPLPEFTGIPKQEP